MLTDTPNQYVEMIAFMAWHGHCFGRHEGTRTMKSYLSIFVFIFVASACSKISSQQVDPSSIYGNVVVDREGSSVNVSNTFYVGGDTGTVVTMDTPASVAVNGSQAQASNDPILNSTSYTATFSASVPSIDVTYTDKNGKVYNNTVLTPGDLWNTSLPSTISMASGFSFTVNTDSAFSSSEQIIVILNAGNGFSEYATSVSANSTTQRISVPGGAFQGFLSGAGSIQTCRSSSPAAAEPYPEGTSISVKSCSSTTGVTVTP